MESHKIPWFQTTNQVFHGDSAPVRWPIRFQKKNVETRARNKRFFMGIEIIFSLTIGILGNSRVYIYYLVGGFNHLEKYESQWKGLSQILWKNNK